MPDKPPTPPRLRDNFASFDAAALGHGTRRKARWVINPTRAAAHASAEAARLASMEAELYAGLGRRKPE